MNKVLLSRIGCRYTCNFCTPKKPYEKAEYSQEKNFELFKNEIDSATSQYDSFVIGGIDCSEDLDLIFKTIAYIREKKGPSIKISIESHCAEFQNKTLVNEIRPHISKIVLPIYGSTPEIHHTVMTPKDGTKITGFPQLEAIDNCLKAGINAAVHTVITDSNKDDLVNIIDTLYETAKRNNKPIQYTVRPVYLTSDANKSYIAVKDMSPYLNKAQKRLIQINMHEKFLIYGFNGFPFCLFDKFEINIQNPDFNNKLLEEYTLYVGQQLPTSKQNYSTIDPRIPNYRIRTHTPICKECIVKEYCAGFQKIDFERFGTGSIQPIQQ